MAADENLRQNNGHVVEEIFEHQESKENDKDSSEYRCGYKCCTPNFLQTFNKPPWLLACIMMLSFVQGFVSSGIRSVNTSTLERRFELSSSQVAWIATTYDLFAGIFSVVFGYLGTFKHKGSMIAFGTLMLGVGSLVMVLPHFLAGLYTIGGLDSDLCDLSGNRTDCTEGGGTNNYMGIFITAQLFNAVGGGAALTLSIPYLDENVSRRDSTFYLGCMMAMQAFGPGLGFVAGGYFLTIYVDVLRVDMDDITITPSDPRWVGAWWIGFITAGFVAILASFLIGCFPKEIRGAEQIKAEQETETYKGLGIKETADELFGRKPKDVLVSLKILFKNPIYDLLTLVGIFEFGALSGFIIFLPKIIQFQFAQTPARAALWSGVTIVPGATFGILFGGWISKKMNLKVRGLLTQLLIASCISWVLILQFLLKCDMPKIAGISVPYYNSSLDMDSNNPNIDYYCNQNCSCTTISYDPVCGQNGVTYFTPCHAGCLSANDTMDKEIYHECSCIDMETDLEPSLPDAEAGACFTECDVLPIFLVLFLMINITATMPAAAGLSLSMRIVPEKQRSFAYGVQAVLVRLLGTAPGPLILGLIFDNSCWLWQEQCGERGSCWIYNVDDISRGITEAGIILKSLSITGTTLCLILYKPPPPVLEEEKEMGVIDNKGLESISKTGIVGDKDNVDPTYLEKDHENDDIDSNTNIGFELDESQSCEMTSL